MKANDAGREKWSLLLSSWIDEITGLWKSNQQAWDDLGLPPVAELHMERPDEEGLARLEAACGMFLDPEVLSFYRVSNGWPLWLGSFWCQILPSKQIGLFKSVYQEAFSIAKASAPKHSDSATSDISIDDLETAIVLSGPDAREFVLSLESGKTCLYYFDGMHLFTNFFEFMVHRRTAVREWLVDMLRM